MIKDSYINIFMYLTSVPAYFVRSHITCFLLFPLFSRLYRDLEDYDVVRGIFGGKIGTKSITCAALQAEANTDFAEAVKLYNEV